LTSDLILELCGAKRDYCAEDVPVRSSIPTTRKKGVDGLDNFWGGKDSFPLALINAYLAVPDITCITDEVNAALVLAWIAVKEALAYICFSTGDA